MGRHKKHPEHENLERWLVSYADFITLLFATFTALYAISTADLAKLQQFKAVAEGIQQAFVQQSLMNGIQTVLQGKSPPNRNPDAAMKDPRGMGDGVMGDFQSLTYKEGNIEGKPQADEEKADAQTLDELRKDIALLNQAIEQALGQGNQDSQGEQGSTQDANAPDPISLITNERGTTVRIESKLLFAPGSAQLLPASRKALAQIADKLQKLVHQNRVHVEGHTDSQAISSALYPSNWELSTARASAVVRFLVNEQFPPAQMAAVGYAASRPVATNATPVGRSQNRRIEIALLEGDPLHEAPSANNPVIVNKPQVILRSGTAIKSEEAPGKTPLKIPVAKAPTKKPASGHAPAGHTAPAPAAEDQLLFKADDLS
ncbi:MAG: OmpA family protein [Vampirovibrionales bacterium]|nr:OmpA family protein [Vampirovibrionales bacterium]